MRRRERFNLHSSPLGSSQSWSSVGIYNPGGHPPQTPYPGRPVLTNLWMGSQGCAEDAPVERRETFGNKAIPKSGEVHGLELVAYVVAQGSETVHVLGKSSAWWP